MNMQSIGQSRKLENQNDQLELLGIDETNDEIKIGDFVQVIDNASGRIVIQGQISGHKTNSSPEHKLEGEERLLSVDGRHYFKLDDDAYTVKKLDVNYADDNFIEANYNERPWGRYNDYDRSKVNMYRDNSIDELDIEVKHVVDTINMFSPSMHTEGSCSGHGKHQAWVSITFEDLRDLNDFLDALVPFKMKIDLTTDEHINVSRNVFCGKPFFPRHVEMCLKTKEIGAPAWQALDEFADYLNLIIRARDRSFKLVDRIITRQFETSVLGKTNGESEA